MAAAAPQVREPQVEQLSYSCEDGISFTIVAERRKARVMTASGTYELVRHRSSIGRKYSSATVAFIQDEDRAVLVGADGGPFRDCHQRK